MNKSAKSQRTFWCLLPSFTRYSLILLLSGVLLSESVGATSQRRLQIAQQAKRVYSDSFSENILGKVPASVNITSLRLQIAQSPATKPQNTKPALSPEEAKIKPLKDKASQLFKEAIELDQQPSAASQRQAITKLEEALKIWRLPEIRAVIPQEARSSEAWTLYAIASPYSKLNENTKALGYLEQALAISRELKDRLGEADILLAFSNIYGINLTQYTKAVGYLEQALAILRESKEPKARSSQGLTLLGLGVFYRELGEKQKAIDAYNQAQSLYHAENKPKKEQALVDN